MAVGEIYTAVIEQSLHNQRILNVLHYEEIVTSATPSADLATAVTADIVPDMKGVQSNELSHVRVVTQKIHPLPPLVPTESVGGAGAGTVAQNSLPTSVTVVITKRTAFAGRKYRGRVYVAGVPVTHEDNSKLAAAVMAAWAAFATKLDQNIGGGALAEFRPVVWHRASKTKDNVTLAVVRDILRNQRRRQVGRGE